MTDVCSLSGTAQARLIRNGEVSATELVEAHLRRIEQVNPCLNAVAEVLEETARQSAANVDRERARGNPLPALAGVPFSVKDSIEVEGTVCTAGTLGPEIGPAFDPGCDGSSAPARRRCDSNRSNELAGSLVRVRKRQPDPRPHQQSLRFLAHIRRLQRRRGRTDRCVRISVRPRKRRRGKCSIAGAFLRHREHQAHFGTPASHRPCSPGGRVDRNAVANRSDGTTRGGPERHDVVVGRSRWPRSHRSRHAVRRSRASTDERSPDRILYRFNRRGRTSGRCARA